MPKFFAKRTAEEVKKFLEAHGYRMVNRNGDDQLWARDDCGYTVKVPDRNEEIPRGTLGNIARCLGRCGFRKKYVINWWKENGCGE